MSIVWVSSRFSDNCQSCILHVFFCEIMNLLHFKGKGPNTLNDQNTSTDNWFLSYFCAYIVFDTSNQKKILPICMFHGHSISTCSDLIKHLTASICSDSHSRKSETQFHYGLNSSAYDQTVRPATNWNIRLEFWTGVTFLSCFIITFITGLWPW